MGVDERLRRELRSLAPADPSGAYERVLEKRVRRGLVRRVQIVAVAAMVIVGSTLGVYGLLRIFGVGEHATPAVPTEGGILFSDGVGGRSDIFVVQPDGSGLKNVTHDAAGEANAVWSPDGTRIAFLRSEVTAGTSDVYVIDADGTGLEQVTRSGHVGSGPTWSPDGTRLAYVDEGLRVIGVDGADARLLVEGRVGDPTWSPDGKWIAYSLSEPTSRDELSGIPHLWMIPSGGGEPIQLTHGLAIASGPDWSPDGHRLVFIADRDIAVLDLDSGDVHRLTGTDATEVDAYDRDPAWSSDGTQIVFVSDRMEAGFMRLYRMNGDGSGQSLVLEEPFAFAGCCPKPDWAGDAPPIPTASVSLPPSATETPGVPNGSLLGTGLGSIAVTWYHGFPDTDHDLALVSTDDGTVTPLTSGTRVDSQAAWSPDGSTIAFWSAPREGTPGPGIYTVPATGGEPTLLLETDLSVWSISWSPQGDRIAFVGVNPVDGSQSDMPMAVYTMASDGSDLQQLTSEGQVMAAAWSPDGTRLAITRSYAVGERKTGNDIYVLDLETGEEQRLTNDGTAWKPSWSPDGTRIAFTSNDTGAIRDADLYVINADGSGRIRLTDTPEIEEDTAWAPDGSAIAVTRFGLGEPRGCDLVLVAPDGSSERVLVDGPTDGSCAISLSWQPATG
jgi:Tol biopolymer transport system component